MRTYKPRNTKIQEANEKSLMQLIKNKDLTMEQKRALVAERNPYLYIFGEKLEVVYG
jgi:hypothetical protein